jgi:hypothetical protein
MDGKPQNPTEHLNSTGGPSNWQLIPLRHTDARSQAEELDPASGHPRSQVGSALPIPQDNVLLLRISMNLAVTSSRSLMTWVMDPKMFREQP